MKCPKCPGKIAAPIPCRLACGSNAHPWEHLHYRCQGCGEHRVVAREMDN